MQNIIFGVVTIVISITIAVYLITKKCKMVQEPISKKLQMILGISSIIIMIGGYTIISNYSFYNHKAELEKMRLEDPNNFTEEMANSESKTIPTWIQLSDGVKTIFKKEEIKTSILSSVMGLDALDEVEEPERMITTALGATLKRFTLGFTISAILGVYLGLMAGALFTVEGFFSLPLIFMSSIIPTAAMGVFFVLFGIKLGMFTSVIIFGTFPAIAISVCNEVKSFPTELKYKSYTLGASHFEVIWNAIFKTKLPQIIEIIKNQYGPAMVYLIAAELVVAGSGIGYQIRVHMRKLDMTVVFPLLIILVFVGVTLKFSLDLLSKKLCPWYHKRK